MIASAVTSTVSRSPGTIPNARRALLGTTTWCLVLTFTIRRPRVG
jgi:hypothetical protein